MQFAPQTLTVKAGDRVLWQNKDLVPHTATPPRSSTREASRRMHRGRDDDQALAQRIADGDRAAFERLMRRHNRCLCRLARATLRDDAEAEDALQEAYLSAHRSIGQFRGGAALSTWLFRLVLNECLKRLRRQARRDNVVPMVNLPTDSELDTMTASNAEMPDKVLARSEMRILLERKL